MQDVTKLPDAALAMYLRARMRTLSKIAMARGIIIDMYANEEGYAAVNFGDYKYAELDRNDPGAYISTYRAAAQRSGNS